MSAWTAFMEAENFVRGVELGVERFGEFGCREAGITGQTPTGFVYFIAIGDPYITHVKIGFTSKHPASRLKGLQTGCPFKMRLLGFIFGTEDMERELHDVLKIDRAEGEWFRFSEYAELIVLGELKAAAE
jgi:hypothetical protein